MTGNDVLIDGVKLRMHGNIPENILKQLAVAIAKTHRKIPVIRSNCWQCAMQLKENITGVAKGQVTTILGSEDLFNDPSGVIRPEFWRRPVGYSNHWVTYTIINGRHITIDMTSKEYLGNDNIDAEIIVAKSAQQIKNKVKYYYNGNKWFTWEEGQSWFHNFEGLDQAQLIKKPTGGIDFTANKTPLEIKNAGEGIKFHIDPAILQQLQNAPGFVPVIISVGAAY